MLVHIGQYVSSAAGPLAHHHGDGGALLEVLADGEDHVGAPLEYQGHDGDTLADACGGGGELRVKIGDSAPVTVCQRSDAIKTPAAVITRLPPPPYALRNRVCGLVMTGTDEDTVI